MKKIASLILACVMLHASLASAASTVYASEADKVLFSQTYDDVTTHTKPVAGTFNAQEIYVAQSGKSNKELVLRSNKDNFITAEYSGLTLPPQFGFTFEIALRSGKVTGDLSFKGTGSKSIKILSFTPNEGIKNLEGYRIGGFRKQKQRITVLYDQVKSVYSVYINDTCVNKDYYLKSSQLVTDISSVKLSLFPESDDMVEANIDNFHIYTGTEFKKASFFPKAAWNSNSIEYESPNLTSEESVYFIRDFDEPLKKPFHRMATRIQSGSSATMEVVTAKDGNKYLEWVDDGMGERLDAIMNYPYEYTNEDNTDKRFVIVQFNMSGTDLAANTTSVNIEDVGRINNLTLWKTSAYNIIAGGKTIGTLKKGEWTNIAAVMDVAYKTCDLYVNYELAASDVAFNCSDFGYANMLKISSNKGTIHLDNIAVYSGKTPKPMSYDSYQAESMVEADQVDMSVLKMIEVLNTGSKRLYYKGELAAQGDSLFIEKDGNILVNAQTIADMYGEQADIKGENVKIKGKNLSGAVFENEAVYAPYNEVFSLFGKETYYDDRGIIVAYSGDLDTTAYGNYRDYGLWDVFDYTNYDRPSAEQLVSDFNNAKSSGVHPRLVHSAEDIATVKENIAKYDTIKAMYERKLKTADSYIGVAPLEIDTSDHNAVSRKFFSRIMALSEAYLLSNDTKYAQQVWSDLEHIFNKWDAWYPFVALGHAAIMSAVSIAYDWCYDYYTPQQRQLIEDAIYKRCLLNGYDVFNGRADINAREFLNGIHNRNAVISSSYLIACVSVLDVYPDEASALLHQVLKELELYGRAFFPGGAYDEGFSYWTYGMQYFTRAVATLDISFGTDYRLFDAPDLDKSPYWIVHGSSLKEPNNYHDSNSGSPLACMGDFGYLSRKLNDEALGELRLIYYDKLKNQNNDIWYTDPEKINLSGEVSMELDSYFPILEQINLRSAWGTNEATFLSAHAGYSLPSHGHLDTGAFVFEMLGERWACELPNENYDYKSTLAHDTNAKEVAAFGIGYNANPLCYLTRPEGHNTIVINPDYDCGHSFDAFSPVTKFVTDTRGAYAVVDMTDCYREDAVSAIRGYMLGDDRRSVIIRDEVDAVKPDSEMYWFMYTKSDVELVDDKTAILTQNGKQIKMQMVSSDPDAKIETGAAKALPQSPQYQKNSTDDYTKIFVVTKMPDKGYVQVRFIPMTDPKSTSPIEDIAIDNWSVTEGDIVPLPTLDMIYADQIPIESFAKDAYSYNIKLGEGVPVKKITASADDIYDFSITQNDSDGKAVIRVWLKSDPSFYADYTVAFEYIPKLSDYQGYERLSIFGIDSNNIPQAENGPYNLIDDDISTRHAMTDLEGAYVDFDLGSVVTVDAFAMAVYLGDKRVNTFNIEVSADGENWTAVYSGASSGTTQDLEIYNIDAVQARYVRLVPIKCSAGSWYSTTGFYPMKSR